MSARPPVRGRRLTRSAEFERVYRQGRSLANRDFVLYCFANPASERPRLGLSVSRKVGGAVERNHVKRLLREAFAQVQDELVAHHDIVVVARPGSHELAERGGLAAVSASLTELIDRGRLRETDSRDPSPSAAGGVSDPLEQPREPGETQLTVEEIERR